MKKILNVAMMMIALAAVFTSCQKNVEVTDLKIDSAITVVVGQTATISATTTPSGAKISWTSKDEKICTVDAKGVVTGVAKGEAYVTAVAGTQAAMCKVTVKADASNVKFNIAVSNIGASAATVTFTPSSDDVYYYATILDKEMYDGLEAGEYSSYEINNAVEYLTYMVQYYYDAYTQYGYDITYEDLLYSGEAGGEISSLTPSTNYVAIAAYADVETGECSEPVATKDFTTAEAVMSDNQITMAYASGKVNVTTTNNDPYFFILETKADYDGYQSDLTQASVLAEVQDWIATAENYSMQDYFTFKGSQAIDVNELWTTYLSETAMADGQYIALAVGYVGYTNTDAVYVVFDYTAAAGVQVRDFGQVKDNAKLARLAKNALNVPAKPYVLK